MVEKHLPKYTGPEAKMLLCGPPPMIKAMTGYCEELGYPKVSILIFHSFFTYKYQAEVISKMDHGIFKF
jgi:hypothetical protein